MLTDPEQSAVAALQKEVMISGALGTLQSVYDEAPWHVKFVAGWYLEGKIDDLSDALANARAEVDEAYPEYRYVREKE